MSPVPLLLVSVLGLLALLVAVGQVVFSPVATQVHVLLTNCDRLSVMVGVSLATSGMPMVAEGFTGWFFSVIA